MQQQAEDDQQAEQDALTSLTQDANFDSDLGSIADDVKSTAADLASTRADAKDGPGDDCQNASSTVYNDAATTVYNDAATTLYNDVLTLSRDIDTAKEDLTDVQSAQKQLETDGVPGSADAPATIRAAQGTIAAATKAANADIDKVNRSMAEAYKVANSIATGSCAGLGPGDPPEPLAHI